MKVFILNKVRRNLFLHIIFMLSISCANLKAQNIDFQTIILSKANYSDSTSNITYLGEVILNDSNTLYILNHTLRFAYNRINYRIWIFNNEGSLGYYLLNNENDFPIKLNTNGELVFKNGNRVNFLSGVPKGIYGMDYSGFTRWKYSYDEYPRDW
jgi:hypothetical protein